MATHKQTQAKNGKPLVSLGYGCFDAAGPLRVAMLDSCPSNQAFPKFELDSGTRGQSQTDLRARRLLNDGGYNFIYRFVGLKYSIGFN